MWRAAIGPMPCWRPPACRAPTCRGWSKATQQSGQLTAQAAQLLGMDRVPVAGGGGDNAASAVGMGVIAPGQAFLSLGTSGVLFVVTDRFRPNPQRAAHAFCHAIPGCWHQMAVLLSAASALDWVAQLLGATDLPQLVESAQARGLERRFAVLPALSVRGANAAQ